MRRYKSQPDEIHVGQPHAVESILLHPKVINYLQRMCTQNQMAKTKYTGKVGQQEFKDYRVVVKNEVPRGTPRLPIQRLGLQLSPVAKKLEERPSNAAKFFLTNRRRIVGRNEYYSQGNINHLPQQLDLGLVRQFVVNEPVSIVNHHPPSAKFQDCVLKPRLLWGKPTPHKHTLVVDYRLAQGDEAVKLFAVLRDRMHIAVIYDSYYDRFSTITDQLRQLSVTYDSLYCIRTIKHRIQNLQYYLVDYSELVGATREIYVLSYMDADCKRSLHREPQDLLIRNLPINLIEGVKMTVIYGTESAPTIHALIACKYDLRTHNTGTQIMIHMGPISRRIMDQRAKRSFFRNIKLKSPSRFNHTDYEDFKELIISRVKAMNVDSGKFQINFLVGDLFARNSYLLEHFKQPRPSFDLPDHWEVDETDTRLLTQILQNQRFLLA